MTEVVAANPLLPFLLPQRGVRGYVVHLREGLDAMFGWRRYPPAVAGLLGQSLAALPLLGADLPHDTQMNLQFQGKGALKLLVAQIDAELHLRGMAKCDSEATAGFAELMRDGLLACLLEPRGGGQRYQAVVEIAGHSLAESLENYFRQSEQLPTLIRLAAGDGVLAGMLLQRLPEGAGRDDANWEHVQTLFATLGEDELRVTDAPTLLRRLFAEDEVRVFEPRLVELVCRCTHASISALMLSLGEGEITEVLREQGRVEVTCEFCGRRYTYADSEVHELFAAACQSDPAEHTRQ